MGDDGIVGRDFFALAAQCFDVGIDCAFKADATMLPGFMDQLFATENLTRRLYQSAQQAKLDSR